MLWAVFRSELGKGRRQSNGSHPVNIQNFQSTLVCHPLSPNPPATVMCQLCWQLTHGRYPRILTWCLFIFHKPQLKPIQRWWPGLHLPPSLPSYYLWVGKWIPFHTGSTSRISTPPCFGICCSPCLEGALCPHLLLPSNFTILQGLVQTPPPLWFPSFQQN